jgi:hypothetical protein
VGDWISADSTLFAFDQNGSRFTVKTWDKRHLVSGRTPLIFNDKISFDGSNDNLIWELNGTQIYSNTITSRSTWNVNRALAIDFSSSPNCLPGIGKPTWTGTFHVSLNGKAMATGFSTTGPQETGIYAVAYYPGKGCRVLNTQTGMVTGDFGPTGQVTGATIRFSLHDAGQTPNDNFVHLSFNYCFNPDGSTYSCSGTLLWQSDSLNLLECGTWPFSAPYCDGHDAQGYNVLAQGKQYKLHPYAGPNSPTYDLTPTPIASGMDDHGSWPQWLGSPDTMPAFRFTTVTQNSSIVNEYPYENEVVGFAADGSGQVYREGFNWNSGWSSDFACANAIGRVSWKGDLALVVSDGWGAFGSTSGENTCTLESGNCRCEIIAIPLK